MILYFSGTGNSLWVAKYIGKALNEPVVAIASELQKGLVELSYSLQANERIVFVFPVHSWGMPVIIPKFIEKMAFADYSRQSIDLVCTCGDDCGKTAMAFRKALSKKGYVLTGAYSVQMPNCYILLPGFDVDKKEVEQAKLSKAPTHLDKIIDSIKQRKAKYLYYMYHKGGMAFLKSNIVYPLFKKFALRSKPFRATELCTSCGLCESICPTRTITLANGKPKWNNTCIQCLACINRCPLHAIEYGKVTIKKGRYKHPDVDL